MPDKIRPSTIPATAQWDPSNNEWCLEEKGTDGSIIKKSFWWPDGSPMSWHELDHGVIHGRGVDLFREDGSIRSECLFNQGRRIVVHFYRPRQPSEDKSRIFEFPETVHKMSMHYNAAGQLTGETYYNAAGEQLTDEGKPLPERPASVPSQASFLKNEWLLGRNDESGSRPVGLIQNWHADGSLNYVSYTSDHADKNERVHAIIRDSGKIKGHPLIVAADIHDQTAVERCLELGLGHIPGTALHAAFAGHHDLAVRVLSGNPAVQPFAQPLPEPQRPEKVPPEATWVPSLGAWVQATLNPATGQLEGRWCQWNGKHSQLEVWEFNQGIPTSAHYYRRPQEDTYYLTKVRYFDAHGVPRERIDYEDGERTEHFLHISAEVAAIRRFEDDIQTVERQVRFRNQQLQLNELVQETWFTPEGVVAAHVSPCDLTDEDGDPLEWYKAVDEKGFVFAEGPVAVGQRQWSGPRGEWALHFEDGRPSQSIDWEQYEALSLARCAHLGSMAHCLFENRDTPLPASLSGLYDINWSELEGYMGMGGEEFPRLITWVAQPNEKLAQKALDQLDYEIIHQGTIASATGPTIRYLIQAALAGDTPVLEDILLLALRVATRELEMGAALPLRSLISSTYSTPDTIEDVLERVGSDYMEVYAVLADHALKWAALAQRKDLSLRIQRFAVCLLALAPTEQAAKELCALVPALASTEGKNRRLVLGDAILGLCLIPGAMSEATLHTFINDADPVIQFVAAMALILGEAQDRSAAIPTLVQALKEEDKFNGYMALLLSMNSPADDAVQALSLLPTEYAITLVDQMLEVFANANPLAAIAVAHSLLDIVFPDSAYEEGQTLDDKQRTVLQAIADNDAVWTFVNFFDVLRENNLPCEREKIQEIALK